MVLTPQEDMTTKSIMVKISQSGIYVMELDSNIIQAKFQSDNSNFGFEKIKKENCGRQFSKCNFRVVIVVLNDRFRILKKNSQEGHIL